MSPVGCTVLIAAPDLLPILKSQSFGDGELLDFSDAEALRALEAIIRRLPQLIVLEREFAATPRGVALVNRLKADPTLAGSKIRIVSAGAGPEAATIEGPPEAAAPAAKAAAVHLDDFGTRRAPRFNMAAHVEAEVNGHRTTLVEMSTIGARVLSGTILKPNQRVRVALNDDHGTVRFTAVVIEAAFEMPPGLGSRYRVRLEFVDAGPEAVDAFRVRHQAS